MTTSYELTDPARLRDYSAREYVYGRSEWAEQFGLAEWTDEMEYPAEPTRCPNNPNHRHLVERSMDLHIVLPSPRVGDFVWTWYHDCLITDRVLALFRRESITGFRTRPVVVEKVKGRRGKAQEEVPRLWELVVIGRGGDARPESGIRIIYQCPVCGFTRYSSYRHGILVDEIQWDGSDIFTVNGYPKHILVTERVKNLIVREQLTNCALILARALRWPNIPRPEDMPSSYE